MAGLGTALGLMEAEPGLNLAVPEARHLGYGASGRNAGTVEVPMLMPARLRALGLGLRLLMRSAAGGHR